VGDLRVRRFPFTFVLDLFYIYSTFISKMVEDVGPFNSFRALLCVAKDQVDP
jgi:hypothetical protein